MTYVMPNSTNVAGLAGYANTVTGGSFWTLILFAIFGVTFFATKNYETPRAFATASFITFLISGLLYGMQLVPLSATIICAILGAGGLAMLRISNSKEY